MKQGEQEANHALEKFQRFFYSLKQGIAFCEICNQKVMIENSLETDFWRHQTEKIHIDGALEHFRTCETLHCHQGERKEALSNVKKPQGHFQEKKIFHEEDKPPVYQEQKAEKQKTNTNNKDSTNRIKPDFSNDKEEKNKSIEVVISSVSNAQGQKTGAFSSSLMPDNESLEDIEAQVDQKQTQPQTKKLKQSFSELEKAHFTNFINQLMQGEYWAEALCFLLGRIGVTTKQLSDLKVKQAKYLSIKFFHQYRNAPWSKVLYEMLQTVLNKLKEKNEYNDEMKITKWKSPKELRKALEKRRKKLQTANDDYGFLQFLERAKLKSFNALFQANEKKRVLEENIKVNYIEIVEEKLEIAKITGENINNNNRSKVTDETPNQALQNPEQIAEIIQKNQEKQDQQISQFDMNQNKQEKKHESQEKRKNPYDGVWLDLKDPIQVLENQRKIEARKMKEAEKREKKTQDQMINQEKQ